MKKEKQLFLKCEEWIQSNKEHKETKVKTKKKQNTICETDSTKKEKEFTDK